MKRIGAQTVVNFASERQMLQVKIREEELSLCNIKSVLDAVKKSYKDLTSRYVGQEHGPNYRYRQ